MKQNDLPENFDLVYDFLNNNFDELLSLSSADRKLVLYWLQKQSDHLLNYDFAKSEN